MPRKKLPWWKAFVKDILADSELKSVPLEARGLWLYMMCLMHQSPRRGVLLQENGSPIPPELLAIYAGCSPEKAAHLYQTLITSGVFSVSDDGFVYSRRMVRESRISIIRAEAGRKGGESSVLLKQNLKQKSSKSVEYGMCSSFDKENEKEEYIPIGKGVQGEGVLLEQNSSKTQQDHDLSPEWLARIWVDQCRDVRNRSKRDKVEDVSPQFAEWIRNGVPAEKINAEMGKNRDRTEHLWQFKIRLVAAPPQKKQQGHISDEFLRRAGGEV